MLTHQLVCTQVFKLVFFILVVFVLVLCASFTSAAPGALLPNTDTSACYETRGIDQGGSGSGQVCMPAGEHIVFVGDSTMRYQYEHLAYAVAPRP